MDMIPDMDKLLDELEASEETKQSDPNPRLINANTIENNRKSEREVVIPFESQISTGIIEKRNAQEEANNDSKEEFSRLRTSSSNTEGFRVNEDDRDALEMATTRKNHSKAADDEMNQPTISSSTLLGSELAMNTANSDESIDDSDGTLLSTKKRSDTDASNRIVDSIERVETPTMASDEDFTKHLCDLPESDQTRSAVKERLADKFMEISLRRLNDEQSDFARNCESTANELDQMAREFEEMDQYLARCAIESGESKVNLSIDEKDLESLNIEPAALCSRSDEINPTMEGDPNDENLEPSESRMGNVDVSTASDRFEDRRVKDDDDSKAEVSSIDTKISKEGDETTIGDQLTETKISKEGNETTIGVKLTPESVKEVIQAAQMAYSEDIGVVTGDASMNGKETKSTMGANVAWQREIAGFKKGNAEQAVAVGGIAKDVDSSLIDREQDLPTHREEENVREVDVDAIGITNRGSIGEKEINEKAEDCENTEQGTERGEEEKDEEGEEANEEAGMDEGTEGSRDEDVTVVSPVEEAQGISVVASTHDISSETDFRRLTESELQLGKVKPVWIADADTTSCMLCCAKFTLILRRHHCRSCGRVLCAQCSAHKAVLPYMKDASKKFKVCEPCFQTLKRIDDYEKGIGSQENSTNPCMNEAGASSSTAPVDVPRMKSVLKVKSSDGNEEAGESAERSSTLGEVSRRSVTFRDGVNPGEGDVDRGANSVSNIPEPSSLIPKPKKKRASVIRRVKELRMEEENICLLPKEADDPIYTRNVDGSIEKVNVEEADRLLTNGQVIAVAISRNLWCDIKICKLDCCGLGRVMCICSCGMLAVGLDEILIVHDLDEDEHCSIPIDIIRRIREIYEFSLKPQNESFDEKMGIRAAHLRVPTLHSTLHKNELSEFAARDILLFRPSLQCFDNLILPSSPFLVACFIHQCEKLWALAIPNRLLYRIGLQASYYPTPIVNRRMRDPVYSSFSDTTVLKVFTDFRNWSYRMLRVYGSTLDLQDDESRLVIPSWAKSDLRNLVESNRNMIAFALDFNADADSHLVCEQDAAGTYRTHVFTTGVTARKVTGASFIIVDGALKSGDVPLSVSVVEDGIAIRLRADAMIAFAEALIAGEDYRLESNTMKFSLEWRNIASRGSIGELVSPIDQSSLVGNYEYGLTESRILSSIYTIPSVNEWALRLVAVYNMAKGKFASLIQSKVFAVSEQIAAQIAYTLVPFVDSLINNGIREICIRIRVSSDDAGYIAAKWPNMEQEYLTWKDLLDNQLVPGLFNICSYIPLGFDTELSMALVSTRTLP
uniref:FYVE-type domain-containing protein n=1 Tax=Parascaris univalens TaxID=6257 RepID=A0A915B519_PARUN